MIGEGGCLHRFPAFEEAGPVDGAILFDNGSDAIFLRMGEEIYGFDQIGLAVDGVDDLSGVVKIDEPDVLPDGGVLLIIAGYVAGGKFE